mgnify:FL=1
MPLVSFDKLPDDAKIWVFGADAPVDDVDSGRLLAAVDGFLMQWKAHGHPLTCARDWRDDRFLVIGVDQRSEGASGCSIDGLYRTLQGVEKGIGTTLVAGGRVFFRDPHGFVHCLSQDDFARMARRGDAGAGTLVFDTTVQTAAAYRTAFERPAAATWHATLLPGA